MLVDESRPRIGGVRSHRIQKRPERGGTRITLEEENSRVLHAVLVSGECHTQWNTYGETSRHQQPAP